MYHDFMATIDDVSTDFSKKIALFGVPSSAGARRTGQEMAPAALRAAGLLHRLERSALDVVDLGDLPAEAFRPDPSSPRAQNVSAALRVAIGVAEQVDSAVAGGRMPLVLGGDCSLSLGVVAGLRRHYPRLGLLYFDGDLDLNTPRTTTSGILDGMVLAHLLGRGVPELARIGSESTALPEDRIVLFGFDTASGWVDPPELDALQSAAMPKYPLERVRADVEGAAREALRDLESRSDGFLVHFDVDVTDLPAADVPHPRGLDLDAALAALQMFVRSPRCAGVAVTEFNADDDPDGSQAERLADGLARAFRAGKGAER